jgi:hypothetical protein
MGEFSKSSCHRIENLTIKENKEEMRGREGENKEKRKRRMRDREGEKEKTKKKRKRRMRERERERGGWRIICRYKGF